MTLKVFCAFSLVVLLSACEDSKVVKKQIIDRGNQFKTSNFGGCDFKSECWDYNGGTFQADFQTQGLKQRCQAEGGQFVVNGCSYQNRLATCELNAGTGTATILHFYKQTGTSLGDVEQLCQAQEGVFRAIEN